MIKYEGVIIRAVLGAVIRALAYYYLPPPNGWELHPCLEAPLHRQKLWVQNNFVIEFSNSIEMRCLLVHKDWFHGSLLAFVTLNCGKNFVDKVLEL